MLQLRDICKSYKTGTLVQKALDHVSLDLRDNEFVSILGPSGSGKSTLLNIIGGLDHYDSGDLIINGISTKKYKDRDWDSYRNHTIGFIFQSYNLIPHQSVLANVELALTISGISRSERVKRAKEALDKVGLGDQVHKKPYQLSGGQMQRVAIARALVNDPDILLADEPTGALDSETSIQVMDLLKEVARDRLVVMVTHNPELAERYATRIIKLQDGRIISDSDPVEIDKEDTTKAVHKNLGKSSMSFLTALSLSFNNLMTKKARTVLVAFAGSIGIIGIALIMSLSNGVNNYIKHTEVDTLSEYPLQIQKSGIDLASMMGNMGGSSIVNDKDQNAAVEEDIVESMFKRVTQNDLKSFKSYIDSGKSGIEPFTRTIEYTYAITPILYRVDGDRVIQVNPDSLLNSTGMIPTSSVYSSMFSSNIFSALPEDADLYKDAYEVKSGRWPDNDNEVVVVLDKEGHVSDMTLYTLGVKDYKTLEDIISRFMNNESSDDDKSEDDGDGTEIPYDSLVGAEFKLISNSDLYTYDKDMKVWTDRSADSEFVKKLVEKAESIKVVGVVQPTPDTDISMLSAGISYSAGLPRHVAELNRDSKIVKEQLADKNINVLTGKAFDDTKKDIDPSELFSIDTDAMKDAFKVDESKLSFNASDLDLSGLTGLSAPEIPSSDLAAAFSGIKIDTSKIDMQKTFNELMEGYAKSSTFSTGVMNYLQSENIREIVRKDLSEFEAKLQEYDAASGTGIAASPAAVAEPGGITVDLMRDRIIGDIAAGFASYAKENGYSSSMEEDFGNYLASDSAKKILEKNVNGLIDFSGLEKSLSVALGKSMQKYMTSITSQISGKLSASIESAMKEMAAKLPEAVYFNTDAFMGAISMNMDETEMGQYFNSMMNSEASAENNLTKFGYADPLDPDGIVIYPKDFESKGEIVKILDDYNAKMKKAGEDGKVITYTDLVGTMMTSVTKIINMVIRQK